MGIQGAFGGYPAAQGAFNPNAILPASMNVYHPTVTWVGPASDQTYSYCAANVGSQTGLTGG